MAIAAQLPRLYVKNAVDFHILMTCIHDRAIVTLDGCWCPDCQRIVPTVPSQNQQFKESIAKNLDRILPTVPAEPLIEIIETIPTVPAQNTTWMKTRTYRSHGSLYYRFAWGVGDTVKQNIHIPGGNTDSQIATARREMVERWIAQGHSPEAIGSAIAKWRRR